MLLIESHARRLLCCCASQRIAVEPTWTEHFGAMQISETAANDSAVEAERPPATRTQDRQYSKLSQLMAAQK